MLRSDALAVVGLVATIVGTLLADEPRRRVLDLLKRAYVSKPPWFLSCKIRAFAEKAEGAERAVFSWVGGLLGVGETIVLGPIVHLLFWTLLVDDALIAVFLTFLTCQGLIVLALTQNWIVPVSDLGCDFGGGPSPVPRRPHDPTPLSPGGHNLIIDLIQEEMMHFRSIGDGAQPRVSIAADLGLDGRVVPSSGDRPPPPEGDTTGPRQVR